MADNKQAEELADLKVPPHSIEAEQSVLGGLLLDKDAWDKISDLLLESDFYRHTHRLIFRVIQRLIDKNTPIDLVTVSEELDAISELENAGGLEYLTNVAQNIPSAANISSYAKIVHDRAVLRKMISAANEISDSAFAPEGRDSELLLDEAEQKIFRIADGRTSDQGPESISDLVFETVERINELSNSDSEMTGVTSGFDELDKKTSGLQKSDLIIVAARPSMGKTTFAMNLVENAVMAENKPVLVFSLEMPANQLVMRMLSSLARIDQTNVRTGKLLDDEVGKLATAAKILKNQKLFIDDSSSLSPSEIRTRARRIAREHGELGMIMIDYLQLMQIKSGKSEGRTAEISEISRSLKALAKEMNCPVVALSQLNRSLENRPNKRPINSDLRESGAIEQDADVIMFIYRDEVYNEDSSEKGIAEIIIGKQRNGPIGTTRLAFIGKYTKFENLAVEHYQGYQE